MDVSSFFQVSEKDNCVYFIGDKLEVFIPERYRAQCFLTLTDKVHCLGVCTLRINEEITCGLQIPGMIAIDPADTYETTIDGEKFLVCVLHKGNRLMCSLSVVQTGSVSYFMWTEFFTYGHIPAFVEYSQAAFLFDFNKEVCGKGLGVNHVIYEVVVAHCFRDKKDKTVLYRHTGMNQPPVMITLKDISYGAQTTHSRIIGAYTEEGMISAALNQVKDNNSLEDLFRS